MTNYYAWVYNNKSEQTNNIIISGEYILFTIEAQILVDKALEQSEHQTINGYQVQVLPFHSSLWPVEIFSIQADVIVNHGFVCALAFFNRNMDVVAVSAPIR